METCLNLKSWATTRRGRGGRATGGRSGVSRVAQASNLAPPDKPSEPPPDWPRRTEEAAFFTPLLAVPSPPFRPPGHSASGPSWPRPKPSRRQADVIHTSFWMRKPRRREGKIESYQTENCSCGPFLDCFCNKTAGKQWKPLKKAEAASFNLNPTILHTTTLTLSFFLPLFSSRFPFQFNLAVLCVACQVSGRGRNGRTARRPTGEPVTPRRRRRRRQERERHKWKRKPIKVVQGEEEADISFGYCCLQNYTINMMKR